MTPLALRAVRDRLGLTQGAAARLVGVDGRTWRYWEAGYRPIPEPVTRLLDLVERVPGALERLQQAVAACAAMETTEMTETKPCTN